jgi:hypothetical protein
VAGLLFASLWAAVVWRFFSGRVGFGGRGLVAPFGVWCWLSGGRFLYYSISLFSLFLRFFYVFILFSPYFLHIIIKARKYGLF